MKRLMTNALWVMVVVAFLTGCQREAPPNHAASDVVPHLTVTLKKTEDGLRLRWRFSNVTVRSVWVVDRISDGNKDLALPVGYVVPPSDLMFVSGALQFGTSRLPGWLIEDNPDFEARYKEIPPGEVLDGSVQIDLPYLCRTIPDPEREPTYAFLAGPFQSPLTDPPGHLHADVHPGQTKIVLETITHVQTAVEYWFARPRTRSEEEDVEPQYPLYPDETTPAARTAVAVFALGAEEFPAHFGSNGGSRMALSKRVAVRIPLKVPVPVHYLGRDVDLFKGTGDKRTPLF